MQHVPMASTAEGLAALQRSPQERFELQRTLATERKARERVDYLVARTASLRLELATAEAKLAQARSELEDAEIAAAAERRRW